MWVLSLFDRTDSCLYNRYSSLLLSRFYHSELTTFISQRLVQKPRFRDSSQVKVIVFPQKGESSESGVLALHFVLGFASQLWCVHISYIAIGRLLNKNIVSFSVNRYLMLTDMLEVAQHVCYLTLLAFNCKMWQL